MRRRTPSRGRRNAGPAARGARAGRPAAGMVRQARRRNPDGQGALTVTRWPVCSASRQVSVMTAAAKPSQALGPDAVRAAAASSQSSGSAS